MHASPVWQDVEVQEQIERDVARTHPDMHFFSGQGSPLHHNRLAGLQADLAAVS